MAGRIATIARMTCSTVGAGSPLQLVVAANGYKTLADAGVHDGERVSWAIIDGAKREEGWGVYTLSSLQVVRNTVSSNNGDAPWSLSGSAEVMLSPSGDDLAPLYDLFHSIYGGL